MTLRKSSGGFTLIELMIVVVIVGVLTLVAYPAYQRFQVKANRAEAQSYLMHLAQRQQLYFNDSRTYAADEDELNSPVPERVDNNYVVSFEIATSEPPPTFTITAVPRTDPPPESLQAKYNDGELSIDNAGEKLHAGEAW